MRLIQAREQARKLNPGKWEHIVFDMVDSGELTVKCEWLDPDAGTFQVIGENGFQTVDDCSNRDPQILDMRMERNF